MYKRVLLAVVVFAGLAFLGGDTGEAADTPRNIILFIGDGMGVSHISAAKTVAGTLNIESMKTCGLITTHSESAFVTDSAAAGTALATGHKTYNGAISVSPAKEPLKTVLEWAEERGKATGLVVTTSVTHATPAAFAAHVDSRGKHNIIAEQIVRSGVDVLFGGGLAYFISESTEGSKRADDKDLVEMLRRRMEVARSADEFRALGDVDSAAFFSALGEPAGVKGREITLAELTKKAIGILSKDSDGFFLMVEGSQIDWRSHDNNKDLVVAEMLDFDDAVGEGLEFARKNGETLVVVTSDHETGGFVVHGGSLSGKEVTDAGFTTGGHTATMVPVFAHGPGSTVFSGIQDNTAVGKALIGYVK